MNLGNIKSLLKISLSVIILLTNAAFKKGDTIRLNTNLNGRTSLNFRKSAGNISHLVKAGTIAEVKNYQQLKSGNYGVQILLNGSEYAGKSEAERTVWIYDWKNRSDDIKGCVDSTCSQEAPSLAAASWAQAKVEQVATQELPESSPTLGAIVDEAAASIKPSQDDDSAQSYKCSRNADSRTCMVCNCYYESRGESLQGKTAVSFVVLARANSGIYPSNVCGVIYQEKQFSWVKSNGNSTIRSTAKNRDSIKQCARSVDYAMQFSNVTGPMWFHAKYASPRWRRNLNHAATIDNHIFYSASGQSKTFAGKLPSTLAEISRATHQGSAQ